MPWCRRTSRRRSSRRPTPPRKKRASTRATYQKAGIAIVGGVALSVLVTMLRVVEFDRAGVMGAAIGAGAGILSLAVSCALVARALRRGTGTALATLMGCAYARVALLVALTLVCRGLAEVDALAFALAFTVFFCLYLAVEMTLVARAVRGEANRVAGVP